MARMGGKTTLRLDQNCGLHDDATMDTGFEFVLTVAIDLFDRIFRTDKPWWIKMLAAFGCLVATLLSSTVLLLIIWALAKAGGTIS